MSSKMNTMIFSQIKESDLKRFIIFSVLLAASLLGAQPDSSVLSLEEARQLALSNNPGYQAKLAELEAADWSAKAALSNFLPTLSLDGTWLYMDPAQTVMAGSTPITLNHDIRSFGFSLSQPLFLGGRIWQGYQMAKISRQMSQTSLEDQRRTLLGEVDNRYLALLQTQDLLRITELDHHSAEVNLQIAQLKFDNGLISNADLLRFQSQLATKDVSQLQASTAFQLSQLNLRNFLGLDTPPQVEAFADPENDPGLLVLENYDTTSTQALTQLALDRGEGSNLALMQLERGLELSRRAYQMSKGSFLPSLMLIGSSEFSENGIDRYEFDNSNTIMVTASLPLLPQLGNYAELKKAEFAYKKNLLEAQSATDGIRLGMESAVLNLVASARQVKAARLALDYTEQSFLQLQQRFRMDLISSKDLLDAELMVSAARTSFSNSFYNYHKARVALMQALGLDTSQELDDLILTGVSK